MITRDGAKMSKSKGNVVSPARARRALRRRHRALLHPLHRAARPGHGLAGRRRGGRAPLPVAALDARPTRRRRTGAATSRPGEAAPSCVRKAHWAIDKVTRDMPARFAFNTAIAAVMELVNEIYRQRDAGAAGALRFAIATAGSLIFPFAPHLGAEVYELLTGGRVWEEPWPEADPALLDARRDRARRAGQRQAARPAAGCRRRDGASELEELARGVRQAGRAPGRQGDRQDGRGARQARELRGAMSGVRRPIPVGPLVAALGAVLLAVSLVPRLVRAVLRLQRLRVPRPGALALALRHRCVVAGDGLGVLRSPLRLRQGAGCSLWLRS